MISSDRNGVHSGGSHEIDTEMCRIRWTVYKTKHFSSTAIRNLCSAAPLWISCLWQNTCKHMWAKDSCQTPALAFVYSYRVCNGPCFKLCGPSLLFYGVLMILLLCLFQCRSTAFLCCAFQMLWFYNGLLFLLCSTRMKMRYESNVSRLWLLQFIRSCSSGRCV